MDPRGIHPLQKAPLSISLLPKTKLQIHDSGKKGHPRAGQPNTGKLQIHVMVPYIDA